ncbi:MAG: ABC transporter permease [Lachnospiraceae bacterium]
MKIFKSVLRDQRILLAIVIIVIIGIVAVINSRFVAVKNLLTILQQISVSGILTMAISMLLISGGIDLSIGNIMILSAVIMAQVVNITGSVFLAVVAGIISAMLCGLLNGFVIAKSKCIPLIISLGTSQIFYGFALTISRGRIMSFNGAFNLIGKSKLFNVFPVMLFVLIIMVALSYVIINKTKFGRRIVAIGGNELNAYLSGINVVKYKITIYSIAGAYCAIAAVIFSARIDSVTANAGIGYETNALTAAIIGGVTFDGGKGTISGAFLGCVLMGVISNAMNILQVQTYIQTIVTGIIIVAAVVLSNLSKRKKN